MQHQANKDRPFASDEMVNASELKDFLFCNLAWFLNQQGFHNTPKAIEERQAGIAFHEHRAEAARKAHSRQALWWAVLLALLGIALLLVRALIESRRG
jgi:hypothetical protein